MHDTQQCENVEKTQNLQSCTLQSKRQTDFPQMEPGCF